MKDQVGARQSDRCLGQIDDYCIRGSILSNGTTTTASTALSLRGSPQRQNNGAARLFEAAGVCWKNEVVTVERHGRFDGVNQINGRFGSGPDQPRCCHS